MPIGATAKFQSAAGEVPPVSRSLPGPPPLQCWVTACPAETTKTITIEVKGDDKKEANETFYLDLFGLSSNAFFTKNRGLGTILNDD